MDSVLPKQSAASLAIAVLYSGVVALRTLEGALVVGLSRESTGKPPTGRARGPPFPSFTSFSCFRNDYRRLLKPASCPGRIAGYFSVPHEIPGRVIGGHSSSYRTRQFVVISPVGASDSFPMIYIERKSIEKLYVPEALVRCSPDSVN